MNTRFRGSLPRILASIALVGLGIVIINLPAIIRRDPGSRFLPRLDPFAPVSDSGTVPADDIPTDSARVLDALRRVQDPEIDISIVDLGLVYRLAVDPDRNVGLTLILTVPECPFARVIAANALDRMSPDARVAAVLAGAWFIYLAARTFFG